MDWLSSNSGLRESDLTRVFKYLPSETTVVRRLTTDPQPVVWSHSSTDNWKEWLEHSCPSIQDASGLVLVIARKGGENKGSVQQILDGTAKFSSSRVDTGFKESFNEKNHSYSWPINEKIEAIAPGGRRPSITARHRHGASQDVRNLTFEKDTFRKICQKFFVHPSIVRTISRADVPLFSRAQVQMEVGLENGSRVAYVYNCRSANTWKDDLALTVTYFPESGMIYAIFFGCTVSIEREILNRISSTDKETFHPMLLPGIFAELERTRMVEIVEATIDEIEGAIHDLDSGVNNKNIEQLRPGSYDPDNPYGSRYGRRNGWLNTTFLRHKLHIWKTQLAKMVSHIDELLEADSGPEGKNYSLRAESEECRPLQPHLDHATLKRTSLMIKDRLQSLIEEFEEKIADCTMSIDGMAIATQWSQNDINVDIAIATKQDSSQMRSIALVTMLFLPGTFVATLFSMTFFNWNPSGDKTDTVSPSIWLYFLITGVFTLATLLVWWYFMVRRRGGANASELDHDSEEV